MSAIAAVVHHHGIFHVGEAHDDRGFLVRIRNAGPVVREPVERVAAEADHVVIVGRRIGVRGLHARAAVRCVVHDDARSVPIVMIAHVERDVGNVAAR